MTHWTQASPTVLASFLASLVECVEALTVVLAVGTRNWRSALTGAASGLLVVALLIASLGQALSKIPLHTLQWAVGSLLLLFGLRWLRKAILRSSGHIRLHDEDAAFQKNAASIANVATPSTLDKMVFAAAFQIVLLEGAEVVFIVLAIGAGGAGMLLPASFGALAALILVVLAGFGLRRPLARVPENSLKFAVGVLLSAFGTFWFGEGIGLAWPGGDSSLLGLVLAYLAVAVLTVALCKNLHADQNRTSSHLEVRS